MDNDIKTFENEEFGKIRTVLIDDQTWFVGKDIAMILGYKNTKDALAKRVDTEDKKYGVSICDSIGREQNPVFINESGLYSLILSSKLPKAKKIKRWVTADVLPSIRKTGIYKIPTELNELDNRIKRLESKTGINKIQRPIIGVNTSEIAFSLGISATALFKFLRAIGVANRKWDKYELHDDYVGFGYIQNTRVAYDLCNTKRIKFWTLKGVWFVMDLYNKRQANN